LIIDTAPHAAPDARPRGGCGRPRHHSLSSDIPHKGAARDPAPQEVPSFKSPILFRYSKQGGRETVVSVAIDIPDKIGQALAAYEGGESRAVLEVVAVEMYRKGPITTVQVQQMLGLRSRLETDAFLARAEAYFNFTMDDLERDIAANS
jgi:hypothetical protein